MRPREKLDGQVDETMADVEKILSMQRRYFEAGGTRDVKKRLESLNKLRDGILRHENELSEALRSDLGKSPFEAYETEIGMVLEELKYVSRRLKGWAKPERVSAPVFHFPSSCRILHDPYGVVLIMSPWNYPLQLTLEPLIGAIAGGNCAVVKPSAYSPTCSAALARLLGECFEESLVAVVEGGREQNKELLQLKFDYIFFTGSVSVGKTVMEAASHNLTPVTLELGGKSPCIVCPDADIPLAARRIVWGKFLNAGQTCVAPDYVLAANSVKEQLLSAMKKSIRTFYGENPLESPDLPHIVNRKHFDRIRGYLGCGEIAAGGRLDENSLRIEPTILTDPEPDSPVMQEEIFGPVLPVVGFDTLEQVIGRLEKRPKPLALYLFTNSRENRRAVLERVRFGGGCVNDTIVHLASSAMPFGGVGESGMGGYHGKWSFETFTREKSVLMKSNRLDIALRYPPYKNRLGLLQRLMH